MNNKGELRDLRRREPGGLFGFGTPGWKGLKEEFKGNDGVFKDY